MMVSVDVWNGPRRCRVFLSTIPREAELRSMGRMVEAECDETDEAREPLLRARLRRPIVRAVAYPGFDPNDVHHVYLGDGVPLFACTVWTMRQVEMAVAHGSPFIEGLNSQVASGHDLTVQSLQAAVEAWAVRNFPDVPIPRFVLDLWVDSGEAAAPQEPAGS